ncbi:MAG: hypothetical protein ACK55Z_30740, partial [bacterium]
MNCKNSSADCCCPLCLVSPSPSCKPNLLHDPTSESENKASMNFATIDESSPASFPGSMAAIN